MIDTGEEPEVGHPLRKAYWDVRDRYETSLMREMYIGDQPDIKFQLDFPKAVKDWPGTMTQLGRFPGGDDRALPQVRQHGLEHPAHHLAQPGEKIDKTLAPLKKPRWNNYYHGIDISEKAVKESKVGAEEYFKKHVQSAIEKHGENADRL